VSVSILQAGVSDAAHDAAVAAAGLPEHVVRALREGRLGYIDGDDSDTPHDGAVVEGGGAAAGAGGPTATAAAAHTRKRGRA
jgi:hypothetical protein